MRLTPEQIKEVTSITDDQITKELLIRWFGNNAQTLKPKYQPNDWFPLEAGMISVYKEKTPIKTTIGRFIFNKFLNESIFGSDMFPYWNKSSYKGFDNMVCDAAIDGLINAKQISDYQTKINWLCYTPTEILVPGASYDSMKPHPKIVAKKKELFKKYEAELKAGKVEYASRIESELLDYIKEEMKDDPALRLYQSKKPSLGNNYKNMCLMVGAVKSNTDGSFYISENSYIDGIDPDEYHHFADQSITGSYSRSVSTQVGGALVKEIQAAMQSERLDPNPKSDCGSTMGIRVTLTKENVDIYMYRYFFTTKGLMMLTHKNSDQLIGKTVKFRSVLFCKNQRYCEKCAGALFNRLGIQNVGLTVSDLGSKILNTSMKSMHDTTVHFTDMEFEKRFKDF